MHSSALVLGLAALVIAGRVPTVDTGYATFVGVRNLTFPSAAEFLGIPYAEPPLGVRRWRNPVSLDTSRHQGVVDASKYKPVCVQGSLGLGDAGGAGSEDCLNVDIWKPVNATAGDDLPVLVYIHGGGYLFGNPAANPFAHWIQQSPNFVAVSVYYRLDSLGFLAAPDFDGDLNVGFQDQTEALRWVQKHIRAFGGDPKKVTINGESAGGSSVELHLVAEGGEQGGQLFRGAIGQSVYRTPVATAAEKEPLFNMFAARAGCGNSSSAKAKLACLRKASISAIARSQDSLTGTEEFNATRNLFQPVVDGKVFTDFPTRSILAGKSANVPVMFGANSNETLAKGTNITSELIGFFPKMSTSDVNKLLAAYPAPEFPSADARFREITGDSEVRCAREIIGGEYVKRGLPAFTYRYNSPSVGSDSPLVEHAAENSMMYLALNIGPNATIIPSLPISPAQVAFGHELTAYWISFVRSLDPNTYKLARSPKWPAAKEGKRMVLATGTATTSGSTIEQEPSATVQRCRLAAELVEKQEA